MNRPNVNRLTSALPLRLSAGWNRLFSVVALLVLSLIHISEPTRPY